MKINSKTIVFAYALVIVSLLFTGPLWAATQIYEVQDSGKLILPVPDAWEAKTIKGQDPLTVVLKPKSGERALVSISVFRDQEGVAGFNSPDSIKESLIKQGKNIVPQSEEQALNIFPIKRSSDAGYFYLLTDKDPKPEGYRVVTQGGIGTGDLLIMFTVLTDRKDSTVIKHTLTMLKLSLHRN